MRTKGNEVADILGDILNTIEDPQCRANACLRFMAIAQERHASCTDLTAEETASLFLDGLVVK